MQARMYLDKEVRNRQKHCISLINEPNSEKELIVKLV